MVEPDQKGNSPYKDLRASTKVVMHVVEQRGCAVLWIASPRCNHQQLRRLAVAIQEKRPTRLREEMVLHDNVRPYSANLTKKHYTELDWEVILHPLYSPDLAPLDFQLLPYLSNMGGSPGDVSENPVT